MPFHTNYCVLGRTTEIAWEFLDFTVNLLVPIAIFSLAIAENLWKSYQLNKFHVYI